jgi:hypothetical protein
MAVSLKNIRGIQFDGGMTLRKQPGADNILEILGGTFALGEAHQGLAGGELVINDASLDVDFRIESGSNANMFAIDGGQDCVMIGEAPGVALTDAAAVLHIQGANGAVFEFFGLGGSGFELNASGSLIFNCAQFVVNEDGIDADARFEGNNNVNLVILDAGLDSIGLGAAAVAGSFLSVTGSAQSRGFLTGIGVGVEIPLATYTDTDTASGTNAIQALVSLGTPTFGATSGTSVITRGATLYIEGAPAQGSNMTLSAAHALWIDAGTSRFEGNVDITGSSTLTVGGRLTASQALTVGTGADGAAVLDTGVFAQGAIIVTRILVDLTDLVVDDADLDIIGENDTANCHFGEILAAVSGTIIGGQMTCLEAPVGAGTVTDIDLYTANVGTGTEGVASGVGSLAGNAALVTSGAAWTAGRSVVLTAMPPDTDFLYLAAGAAGGDNTAFTAGIFLIELYGT